MSKGLTRSFNEFLQGLQDPCCAPPFIIVDTYEDMIVASVGDRVKIIKVRVDSVNNDGDPSTYIYWPSFGIDLVATETIITF